MKTYLYLSITLLICALILQYLDLSMGTTYDSWNIICAIVVVLNTIVLLFLSYQIFSTKDKTIISLVIFYIILLVVYYNNPIRNSVVLPKGELIIECRSEHGGNCWERIYLYQNNEYVYSSGCYGTDALEIGSFSLKDKRISFSRKNFNGFDKQGVFELNKGGIRLTQDDRRELYQTVSINEVEFDYLLMD